MKENIALFGGKPELTNKIYYGHQYIDDEDIKAVVEVLRSDLITCGPKINELEQLLCERTGANYAVLVSNGTAALHLSCLAAGISEGDEVITTPITFAASANCILYCGARPVFADIKKSTYNIDPEEIEKKITPKTKAIIAVDFTGQVVEIDKIKDICKKFNLVFIEDAAHSFGSMYAGKSVGSLADITTFSFHPVKNVTGGEGGAILTNSKEVYERVKLLRTHGIENNSGLPWDNDQIQLGFNYRMTDFQAALIISQIKKLELIKRRRKEIVAMYNKAFSDVKEIVLQQEIDESDTLNHIYILRIKFDMLVADKEELYRAFLAENIVLNIHYKPVYKHSYYQRIGYAEDCCPEAESLYKEMFSIPLYYSLSDDEVNAIIRTVKRIINYYRKK